jgi:uncharacterized protein YecE (DUF72 family)
MRALIGTSGYSYREWKGSFYPDDLPSSRMLRFYSDRFSTVEINNTFYRMPRLETLRAMRDDVPSHFLFSMKAPRAITHLRRLKDVDDPVRYFLEQASVLESHLGPLLFQLPPNLPKDLERLDHFFGIVPDGFRIAVELPHPSWHAEDTYALLRNNGAALCSSDAVAHANAPVSTARFGYVRLRKAHYPDPALEAIAGRLHDSGWDEAFVYFREEDEGKGPEMASELAKRVSH